LRSTTPSSIILSHLDLLVAWALNGVELIFEVKQHRFNKNYGNAYLGRPVT
jgi:hypothetical protein